MAQVRHKGVNPFTFCHRQVGGPIVLTFIDPEAKVLLQPLICMLRLSIRPWVVCSGDVLFNTQDVTQFSGEMGGKSRISVANNFGR